LCALDTTEHAKLTSIGNIHTLHLINNRCVLFSNLSNTRCMYMSRHLYGLYKPNTTEWRIYFKHNLIFTILSVVLSFGIKNTQLSPWFIYFYIYFILFFRILIPNHRSSIIHDFQSNYLYENWRTEKVQCWTFFLVIDTV
jgi:hypothetical protein